MKRKTDVLGEDESWKSPEVVLDLTAQGDKVKFTRIVTTEHLGCSRILQQSHYLVTVYLCSVIQGAHALRFALDCILFFCINIHERAVSKSVQCCRTALQSRMSNNILLYSILLYTQSDHFVLCSAFVVKFISPLCTAVFFPSLSNLTQLKEGYSKLTAN